MLRKVSLIIGFIVLILSSIITIFLVPDQKIGMIDTHLINIYTLIAIINIIVFLRTVNKYIKTWVRFDLFFLIGFFIVHYQTVFLFTYLDIQPRQYNFWTNKNVVTYGIWFTNLAVFSWMLGYYVYFFKLKKIPKRVSFKKNIIVKYTPFFDTIIIAFFMIFAVLVGSSFWSGSYEGASNWGAGATYVFLILRTLFTLRIVYFFIENEEKLNNIVNIRSIIFKNRVFILSFLFYNLIFFIQGDRGPVMQMGLLVIACYTIFIRDVSFTKIFSGIVFAALVFTIVGLGRSSDATSRDDSMLSTGIDKLQDEKNSIIPTDELAWSGSLFFKALDLNREGNAHLNGVTFFNNIIDVIPMSSLVYNPPKYLKSSTSYFTFIYKGPNAKFGVGSAIIADLYINFGFWITLLIFFLFGLLMSKMTIQAHLYKNFNWILVYIIMMSLSVYINRANFLTPLKYIFYLLVFSKIFTKIINLRNESKKSSVPISRS